MRECSYKNLRLISPPFESKIVTLITQLSRLKNAKLVGTTIPEIFSELTKVFHFLESVASARIEGNNTTVSEFFEKISNRNETQDEKLEEIENIYKGLDFILSLEEMAINKTFVSQLHTLVVRGLSRPPSGEGDNTPGAYRTHEVRVGKHNPPLTLSCIEEEMSDLFGFLAKKDKPQFELLKIAIAVHRFLWIHPFGNGNGRVARLFTFALLKMHGYAAKSFLHPAASFCVNRDSYYEKLSIADSGKEENILAWCEFFLQSVYDELVKVARLFDVDYVKNRILLPALRSFLSEQKISDIEFSILALAIEKQRIKNSDVRAKFPKLQIVTVSRYFKKLRERRLLKECKNYEQKYFLSFSDNELAKYVMIQLKKEKFVAKELDEIC